MTTPSGGDKCWPKAVSVLKVKSSIDGTEQPTLYFGPQESAGEDRPLLVALHTWSADFTQGGGQSVFADWCIRHDWYFLNPNFRGPNTNPSACGSDLAIQDVMDALDHVMKKGRVDDNRIYLVGVSGGGHMALLLTGRHPSRWAGVSTWAAIADLQAWWTERSAETQGPAYLKRYATQIESVVRGKPDGSQVEPLIECQKRSPLTYLSPAISEKVNLDINAGINDGRKGSVPFSHSIRAYNQLLPSSKKLGESWIHNFYQRQQTRYDGPATDPLFESRKIHYRSLHKSSRITVFEGGHEILHVAALNWLSCQRLGQPAVFEIPHDAIDWIKADRELTRSGK